jgi:hypothetical protein
MIDILIVWFFLYRWTMKRLSPENKERLKRESHIHYTSKEFDKTLRCKIFNYTMLIPVFVLTALRILVFFTVPPITNIDYLKTGEIYVCLGSDMLMTFVPVHVPACYAIAQYRMKNDPKFPMRRSAEEALKPCYDSDLNDIEACHRFYNRERLYNPESERLSEVMLGIYSKNREDWFNGRNVPGCGFYVSLSEVLKVNKLYIEQLEAAYQVVRDYTERSSCSPWFVTGIFADSWFEATEEVRNSFLLSIPPPEEGIQRECADGFTDETFHRCLMYGFLNYAKGEWTLDEVDLFYAHGIESYYTLNGETLSDYKCIGLSDMIEYLINHKGLLHRRVCELYGPRCAGGGCGIHQKELKDIESAD